MVTTKRAKLEKEKGIQPGRGAESYYRRGGGNKPKIHVLGGKNNVASCASGENGRRDGRLHLNRKGGQGKKLGGNRTGQARLEKG